ncbi:predicted enzyme related to lactoylglutathione lyase [Bacillus oleivorans]|uniref:Predicted enzyme related to lactoylglutathione lyase n=2 Tax=Bacillus oleivorans TaxID=1448271 RepID=A0A285CIH8_9BACI|nr:predicted enzyme related to lactoylglutathione lyase [Bacillus oleivorans]
MDIKNVRQILVPVKNLERAIHFYQVSLQLPFLFQTGNLAFFECNGIRLFLSLPEQEQFAHPSSVIYFEVDNLKESFESLMERGVTFIDEPHLIAKMGDVETWMAFFNDSEGNTHALMSEIHTS